MSDAADTLTVSGDKETLAEFRQALEAHPDFKAATAGRQLRSKQLDATTIAEVFVIHIPAGIVAHALYEWIVAWRSGRGAGVESSKPAG